MYTARVEVVESTQVSRDRCVQSTAQGKPCTLEGYVFRDSNQDGHKQEGEPGVANVAVSNGNEVVLTDRSGHYLLPIPEQVGGVTVFITKPADYALPVDRDNIPQFSYHHLPAGSPKLRFGGLAPTGPLPSAVNFPLAHTGSKQRFKIVVSGDTQPYSNNEIGYLRDTLVKELAARASTTDDIEFVIVEGDVMGDDIGLFPRFKQVMSLARTPVYLVPGNHDVDFDAPSDEHSLDTFRREFGPSYYSFDVGKVHFVVLDDVKYPCTVDDNNDGRHEFCVDPSKPAYTGKVTERQLQWLYNDLQHVPSDRLIVLNLHIPLITFIDQLSSQHQVANVRDIYALLAERPALAFSGHTHTLEQIRPGENFEGWNNAFDQPSGPSPFPQIVSGAACGSWWSGDFADDGVPAAWDRLGGPRGYLIVEFDGNQYKDTFKATGKSARHQMSLSFLSPSFRAWYEKLADWAVADPETRSPVTPVGINDLPDPNIITADDLAGGTQLIANVWNGSRESQVFVSFDGGPEQPLTRTQSGTGEGVAESLDPFALKRQAYVLRYAIRSESGEPRAQGFELYRGSRFNGNPQPQEESLLTDESNHLWRIAVPDGLAKGAHEVRVRTVDLHGNEFSEVLAFEVLDTRPAPFFRTELFE
jgi:3',5'-cyclic AMP phosphodiesterase CpdA